MRRVVTLIGCALVTAGAWAGAARAAFPYLPPGADRHDYTQYRLPAGTTPDDLQGGLVWKFAATPEPLRDNPIQNAQIRASPYELGGVRGAHVVDANPTARTAWETTTGRPDVTIAVLDSGIKWNDAGAMADLRRKVRLNRGELPVPRHDRATSLEPGVDCTKYRAAYDANGDAVFNVIDYACDSRVHLGDPRRVGPPKLLVPQDIIIAFSNGIDGDHNGYVDDIAGWDFLDNDNDPFDDVQYGHGTGEALDSNAEADNGSSTDLSTCPNCTVLPLRVGDSFIADVNRFAQAAIYAVDNRVLVIQEALGTLNNSRFARQAVDYAYNHGVAVIASAADEAAQHHNYPSSLPHTIVVNSVRIYDETFTPQPRSYLQFNGCTNFSSKITVAIPSTSCSSEATGRGAGIAGLIYSAALNARQKGLLAGHPTCRLTDGRPCPISANEVRQLMASGTIDARGLSDDVDFAGPVEPSCATRAPGCTDPNLALQAQVQANRPVISALPETKSYPARGGHDQFYGYGRVNANSAVKALVPSGGGRSLVPPEVEITSPDWWTQIDPHAATAAIRGRVFARGRPFSCRVLVAPGSYPNNATTADGGDFQEVPSPVCDGRVRTAAVDGVLARLDVAALKARFPPDAGSFNGTEKGQSTNVANGGNGRPDPEPYGLVVKVIATTRAATSGSSSPVLTGEDRRNLYLHRDRDLLAGFPRDLRTDGASSPLFVDLNGDNRTELVFGTSDGVVHALEPDGRELAGWPVRGDRLSVLHPGGRAFRGGQVSSDVRGAILASVASADLNGDGVPEVVAADLEGKVYAWSAAGRLLWKRQTRLAYSGKPLRPFVNVRQGKLNRTQHGILASPVLADLDRDGRLEVIVAGLDRHVYAWHADGRAVRGFPVLVVDRAKVASVDPVTNVVTFRSGVGADLNQGAIVDTPAVGDLSGDGRPEIVVGTNEEYSADQDGGLNAGNFNTASLGALNQTGQLNFSNTRVFAIRPSGGSGGSPFLPGWPVKLGQIFAELLPVVGEGVTGNPVIGPTTCSQSGPGPKVGAVSDAGPAYVFRPDGVSCLGRDPSNGKDIAFQTDAGPSGRQVDHPAIPAVGNPAFGNLGGRVRLLAPAAGLIRALDLAANEYQGGQDFVAAWDPQTGQFRAGFPNTVNDLQFLSGPSIADIDGKPGEELLEGSAYLDLTAYHGDGSPVSGFPKLTSDWMVAGPLVGSFGVAETRPGARKTLVGITRSGFLFAWRTAAPACSPGSSPRFHHDNANSGDYRRDAVSPGRPTALRVKGARLTFTAPGDDLLCGTARRYQVVQSNGPITAAGFARLARVGAAPAPAPAGTTQSLVLPRNADRRIAIRAIDDQGNVGRPSVIALSRGQRTVGGGGSGRPGGGRRGGTQDRGGTRGGGGGQSGGRSASQVVRSTSGGSLPFTGYLVLAVLAAGVLLGAGGLLLRRLSRRTS